MAALLETCSREEQRSVILFLSSEGVKPIEIHRRMKTQYGDACLLLQQVYEWDRKFKNGVSSEADADRQGRPHTVYTAERPERIERVITRKMSRYNCSVAMALLTTLGTTYTSTRKCVQDGCQDTSHQNCRNGVWMPVKNFRRVIKLTRKLFFST
jgi:hypothetical protein